MHRRFGSEDCAEQVSLAAGIDVPSIVDCMGDSDADAPHALLQVCVMYSSCCHLRCWQCNIAGSVGVCKHPLHELDLCWLGATVRVRMSRPSWTACATMLPMPRMPCCRESLSHAEGCVAHIAGCATALVGQIVCKHAMHGSDACRLSVIVGAG